jgi:hypothetical protein
MGIGEEFTVASKHAEVYLNDHLAGSTGALEMLDQLAEIDGFEQWAPHLRAEITADREELSTLMREAGIAESTMRQTAAWLTEKVVELKTRLEDRTGGALQRLELLEALALGIEGKRGLWVALRAASEQGAALRGLDYPRLIARAVEQRDLVEARRLEAAAEVFGGFATKPQKHEKHQ